MSQDKNSQLRLSSLLIEELVDADHNCPFRMGTPLFMVLAWYSQSQKTVDEIEKADIV